MEVVNNDKTSRDISVNQEVRAHQAMYHYYLTQAIMISKPEELCINECFSITEDTFVVDLYPYSVLLYRTINEAVKAGKTFSGIAAYESVEPLAQWFWLQIDNQSLVSGAEMPYLESFEAEVQRVIDELSCN